MNQPFTKIRSVLLLFVLTVALVHTSLHVIVYGTGINGLSEKGISGFAIGSRSADEIGQELKTKNPVLNPLSKIVISGEWLVLLTLITGSIILERKKGILEPAIVKPIKPAGKSETDLDALYTLLKEQKKIKFSVISKAFNVPKEVVADWANILESGNLASVNYPRMSEPELTLNETP